MRDNGEIFNLINKNLSRIDDAVNKSRANNIILWYFDLKNTEKVRKKFFEFLFSKMKVPAINNIKLITSMDFNDSPSSRNAKMATNPGVIAKRGSALLISRFFSDIITHKNAPTPINDFIKSTKRLVEFIVW